MLCVSPTVNILYYTHRHMHTGTQNTAYSAPNYRGKYGWISIIWILTGKIFTYTHAHTDTYGYCNIRITTVIKYRIVILRFMCIEMVI